MKQRLVIFIIFLIPLTSLILNILTLSHYGINWDEPYHYRRGQAFLQYLLTGLKTYNIPKYPPLKGDSDNPNFRDGEKNFIEVQNKLSLSDPNARRSFYQDDSWDGRFFIDVENSYGHPPLNDDLAALFNKIFYQKFGIIGDLESYRLFIVLCVSLMTIVVAIFMWKEFGIFESIITSLAITTYPLLLGEQHFNIKDPVEAAFFTLTIIFSYLGIKRNKLSLLFLSAISFAVAFSTKFNIVFTIFPILVWFIYYLATNKKLKRVALIKNILPVVIVTPIISIALLVISYPTIWKDPVNGLLQIVKFYLEVGYPTSAPRGYYYFGFLNTVPAAWIFFTTAPIVIFLFIAACFLFIKLVKKNSFVLLLFFWLFITIGRNSLFHALSYGGVRLIMEYIPAVSMLAGITGGYIARRTKKYSTVIFLIIVLSFVPTIVKLIKIHPNENVYFNFISGGLAGAKDRGLPSWGNSNGNAYYGGVIWLNEHAEPNAKVSTPVGNTSNIPRFKLRKDLAVSPYYWSGLGHKGEYLIELTYDNSSMDWFAMEYLNNAMNPVYEVKVDGVAIAKVWKNDLAHVKDKFLHTKEISAKLTSNLLNKTLRIDLPNLERVIKIQITEPATKCTALKTGYVTSTIDATNWIREPEDIAVNQLDRESTKTLSPMYEFYFFERNAKTFVFNTDSSDNCLLKAESVRVTILNP